MSAPMNPRNSSGEISPKTFESSDFSVCAKFFNRSNALIVGIAVVDFFGVGCLAAAFGRFVADSEQWCLQYIHVTFFDQIRGKTEGRM